MSRFNISHHSDVPIYRQIVAQVTYLMELGELTDGERLPSSRILADNLGVNRNTVAHAYAELRKAGLAESRGRNGMVLTGGDRARATSDARERGRLLLQQAVRECAEMGLGAEEIWELISGIHTFTGDVEPRLTFIECNSDRAEYFSRALSDHLGIEVEPLVLDSLDPTTLDSDLVLTTFFHLADVRQRLRSLGIDVVAIVVAPHLQTLVQISQVPENRTVGIWYSTEDQAASVRDSFAQAGVTRLRVIRDGSDEELADLDVVVVPTETPSIRDQLTGRVRVIEYGNVLDRASLRMVEEVVAELRRHLMRSDVRSGV